MPTSINTILNWFTTGKKPTQAQFWTAWSSFWHKEDEIPQSSISDLIEVLNAKTENDQFNAHKTDENAHSALFAKTNIISNGKFAIYKNPMNTNPDNASALEMNDVACGFIPGTQIFIPFGMYLGGDVSDIENSWNTSPMDFTPPILSGSNALDYTYYNINGVGIPLYSPDFTYIDVILGNIPYTGLSGISEFYINSELKELVLFEGAEVILNTPYIDERRGILEMYVATDLMLVINIGGGNVYGKEETFATIHYAINHSTKSIYFWYSIFRQGSVLNLYDINDENQVYASPDQINLVNQFQNSEQLQADGPPYPFRINGIDVGSNYNRIGTYLISGLNGTLIG